VATYLISELAARAGVPATTLRYYEQAGLLSPARSANGYRHYGDGALDRLALIQAGQHLGLPLAQLRDLLTVRDSGVCADTRARLRPLLAAHLVSARTRAATVADSIARLEQALSAAEPAPPPGACGPGCGCLTDPAPGVLPSPPPPSRSSHQQLVPQRPDPPVACSLDGDGQEVRLGEWRALLTRATAHATLADGLRVTLPAALAGRAAELAAAEQGCCPFFRFTLVLAGGDVQLTIQAPAEAAPLLAAFTDEPEAPVSS
jgi:DNA-binding transcriptional MerR regulator